MVKAFLYGKDKYSNIDKPMDFNTMEEDLNIDEVTLEVDGEENSGIGLSVGCENCGDL